MYCSLKKQEQLFKMTKPLDDKTKRKIDEDLFLCSGYLFKERLGRQSIGYCTCCGKRFSLDELQIEGINIRNSSPIKYMKHNEETFCPNCGKSVIIKDSGRGRSKLIEKSYVGVFQKLRNQTILLRTFAVMRDYSGDYVNVKTKYSEHYRIYFKPGEIYSFRRTNTSYYWFSEYDYYDEDISECYIKFVSMADIPSRLKYPTNFNCFYGYDEEFSTTFYNTEIVETSKYFKYSMFEEFSSGVNDNILHRYLAFYCKHPVLCERLVKEGYDSILERILRHGIKGLNYHSETVKGFFRMNKTELGILKEASGFECINAINAKRYGLELNAKSLAYARREYFTKNEMSRFIADKQLPFNADVLIRYLVKQNSDFSIYRDYLIWIQKYDFELTKKKLFPRYLKQVHDEMMKYNSRMEAIKKENEDKEKIDNFKNNLLPTLERLYSFSDDFYIIRPFKDIKEIVEEGEVQHICVGGSNYTDAYIEGRTNLFCLRKVQSPETPFCTVEVRNETLIQARMQRNESAPDDVKQFLSLWQNEYKKKIKKCKKEVA